MEILSSGLFLFIVLGPTLIWLTNLILQRRMPAVWLYLLVAVMVYVAIVCAAWLGDIQAKADMDSFDLDGDGSLGGPELTPAAERAIDNWASDTGRTMAPILGIPCAALWVGLCMTTLYAGEWLFRRMKPNSRESAASEQAMPPTGNPYQPPNRN